MPIDALKYTSLGLPDKQTESVFGSPVKKKPEHSCHMVHMGWKNPRIRYILSILAGE